MFSRALLEVLRRADMNVVTVVAHYDVNNILRITVKFPRIRPNELFSGTKAERLTATGVTVSMIYTLFAVV